MYEFVVEGMKCGGCASGVTRAVKSVAPDAEVKVDLGAKTVRVQSALERAAISQAIQAAGYRVKDASQQYGLGYL